MEYQVKEVNPVTSGIKRRVKDRVSKTKLNVSLASKIKTKIINNSSIFKISLKHNNRALAQALSREKENSRRITTEKMLLQKEVEKLNFENTFLRLKLNNLNKKLIEIESLMNNSLITAIEMSSLSEFHQSSFLLPASKKRKTSQQGKPSRLPFARVPLTLGDDDDDGGGEQKAQFDNSPSKTSPHIPSSVSAKQPVFSPQCSLELSFCKDLQNVCKIDHSEQTASIVDILSTESCYYSGKSSLVSKVTDALSTSCRREKPSLSNVTERKKQGSSRESSKPTTDILCTADLHQQQTSSPGLNWNNKINDCTNEGESKMQRNSQCFPDSGSKSASNPNAECIDRVMDTGDFQFQKTVYEDADMDLTTAEAIKIITVSKGNKIQSKKKANSGTGTFRKVKDSSSERREKSMRKCKNLDVDITENTGNRSEKESVVLDCKRNSDDLNFIFNTEQLTEANILKEITLPNGFVQDDRQNIPHNKNKKQIHVTNEQEEVSCLFQSSDKFLQGGKSNLCQNTLNYNPMNKASRQTFVIHKSEKDTLFPSQNSKDTISESLEVANEFQIAGLSMKGNEDLCDLKTQNVQLPKRSESQINKSKPRINRRTEVISKMNQIYKDNDKDIHDPVKSNFFLETQANEQTISGKPEVSKEFQKALLPPKRDGDLPDCQIHNVLGLRSQVVDVYSVQHSESKANLRQKINRKTEIISGVSCFNNNQRLHCSEKDNSPFLQKGDELIPGNSEDPNEFQTPALCNKDSGKSHDYETISGMEKHVHDIQPAYQKDLKLDKKHRQKVSRKTEIISECNQAFDNYDKNERKDCLISLSQKDKETCSESLEVANVFQTVDLSTKDNGNLCNHEAHSILDLKNHVTRMQLSQPNESKLNKPKQKVKKTKIISEMNQIYEDIDKDATDQKNNKKDFEFKINKSEQNVELQGFITSHSMQVSGDEKEICDEIPNPYKLVKKQRKKLPGKTNNVLTDQNKSVLHLCSSQTSVTFDSGLSYMTEKADPGSQTELSKMQKQSTSHTQREMHFLEVGKEGNCPAKQVKVKSKSMKRKTLLDPSLVTYEVVETIPMMDHRKSVASEQTNKENYLENEKKAKIKPDFCTKVFKPLSQTCSPNIHSSFDSVCENSIPLHISSSKNLMLQENYIVASSPVFAISGDVHEEMKEVTRKVSRRTQKSGTGSRTLQDLADTNFVPSNTAKSESESEELSSELTKRRRRCAPVNMKEPKLNSKMRR